MKHAYAMLGLAFLIVFVGAYVLMERAEAPERVDDIVTSTNQPDVPMSMQLTSSAFVDGATIPSMYTCDGANTPPPLTVTGVPEGAATLVLVMDDPDIPAEVKEARGIEKFDHWAVYNIPADTTEITVDSGTVALNGRQSNAYTGPCPPPEYQPTTHRYIFRLYALSGSLNFIQAPTLDEVEAAAQGSALATATLVGIYDRSGQ